MREKVSPPFVSVTRNKRNILSFRMRTLNWSQVKSHFSALDTRDKRAKREREKEKEKEVQKQKSIRIKEFGFGRTCDLI
jgi:hypothetical protein